MNGLPRRSAFQGGLSGRAFAALLLAAIGVYCPQVLIGTRTFFFNDFGYFGYPLAVYHRELFWRGEIPFWNPYNCCGLPFLAQWNTLVLYPGSLIYLLLPLPWSVNLFCLAHLWLGGLGMFWIARRWTGDSLAAGLSGMGYSLSGLMLNSLMWPNNIAALGWMPWVVGAVSASGSGRRVPVSAVAVLGGIQMLAGAPEIILLTWLVVGALWLGQILNHTPQGAQEWLRELLRWCALVALVSGIAAAQLIPFQELLSHSHRTGDFVTEKWPIPFSGWAHLLVPVFRSVLTPSGLYHQIGQLWTTSYYVGVPVVACGLLALASWRHWQIRVLAVLILLGLLLAMGQKLGLQSVVEWLIPPLRLMRFPAKYVVIVVFCLPLLAGYGLARIRRSSHPVGSRQLLFVGAGLVGVQVGIVLWAGFKPAAGESGSAVLLSALSRAAFLGVFVLWIWWSQARWGKAPNRWLPFAVLTTLALDLLSHLPRQNPDAEPWMLGPVLTRSGQMEPMPRLGHSRAVMSGMATWRVQRSGLPDLNQDFLVSRLALMGNLNILDRLPTPHGFYSLYLREADQVRSLVAEVTNLQTSPLVSFLSGRQVTRSGVDLEWEPRGDSLPWITGGQRAESRDAEDTLHALASASFDPKSILFLSLEDSRLADTPTSGSLVVHELAVREQSIEGRVEVRGPGPVWLVISQSFYPAWEARVDDQETGIWRANHGFQAFLVDSGQHWLSVTYRDRGFRYGLAVSWASLCLAVGFCLRGWGGVNAPKSKAPV